MMLPGEKKEVEHLLKDAGEAVERATSTTDKDEQILSLIAAVAAYQGIFDLMAKHV